MATSGNNSFLKRIRNHYRIVLMNEDTFEEVIAFRMSRWSVYLSLSLLFILLVGLTIALIAFTPLKFYIPGYGVSGKVTEYESLKLKADSIEHTLILKQQYIDDLQKVLKGDVINPDTTDLKINSDEKESSNDRKRKKFRSR